MLLALVVGLSFALPVARALAYDGVWTGAMAPKWLSDPIGVYDAGRDRVVVLAPDGRQIVGWSILLGPNPRWERLAPASASPSLIPGSAAVYDAKRERMLVVGSVAWGAPVSVWALSLNGIPVWEEVAVAGSAPSHRHGHVVILDEDRDRLIVHGGIESSGAPSSGLWTLDLSDTPAWSPLATSEAAPVARAYHAATYDPLGHRMLMSGGQTGTGVSAETWALSLGDTPAWELLTTAGLGERELHSMVYDVKRARPVVFGGNRSGSPRADALQLSESSTAVWSQIGPAGTIVPVRAHQLTVLDPVRDRLLVFGGGPISDNDVYAVDLADPRGTRSIALRGTATPLTGGLRGIASDGSRLVVLDPVLRTWTLDLSQGERWELLPSAGTPVAGVLVYDAAHDRMLSIGDDGDHVSRPSTRMLVTALSGGASPTWTTITPTGTQPRAFLDFACAYDPVRQRVLMFGGKYWDAYGSPMNDLWALELAGTPTWRLLAPSGTAPSTRTNAVMMYDPIDDRMLLVGGSEYSALKNDAFALQLNGTLRWSPITTTGPRPAVTDYVHAAYDVPGHRVLVLTSQSGPRLWSLDLDGDPNWSEPSILGREPTMPYLSGLFDAPGLGGKIVISNYWDGSEQTVVLALAGSMLDVAGDPGRPAALDFAAPRPNPAHSEVALSFALPRAGRVSLRVHDLAGRALRTLVDGDLAAGPHAARWDVRDGAGHRVAPGVYFAELRHDGERQVRRVVVLE